MHHISILAHDSFEGRGTGSKGIDIAAGYIAGQFASLGIKPGGDSGSYFQTFTIPGDLKVGPQTELIVAGRSSRPALKVDYTPIVQSAEAAFEGEVVFAGYGLTSTESEYDDYDGQDLNGKVVLVFRGQSPLLKEDRPRERVLIERKMERAAELGASAILMVNTKPVADEEDRLIPLGRRRATGQIPAMHITRAFANELLKMGNQASLVELQDKVDAAESSPLPLSGVVVSGNVAFEREDWPSRNVIGLVPGNGPHADQFVVLGAHYDHLGIRDGEIYNGADDNASGTSGIIEICGAIARLPRRDRSLLCMAFTGEEIGLLGSEHYCQNSTVPIGSITSMINLDMIGRWTPGREENELAIQGLGTGSTFSDIVTSRTRQAGIEFLPDPSAKGPSDHASFCEVKVPSLFFFTGVHSDYHRPGDDIEKINSAGGARIATLVSHIAMDLINAPSAPQFAEVDSRPRIFRGPPTTPNRGVMGIMPDPDSPGPGYGVGEVFPGGGADKAGIKAGDRILEVDGTAIKEMSDVMSAMREKKVGDVLSVRILRGKEEQTLQVELTAPPSR